MFQRSSRYHTPMSTAKALTGPHIPGGNNSLIIADMEKFGKGGAATSSPTGSFHHFDFSAMSRGGGYLAIAGQKRRAESFRQRHVGCIVSRQIRPQLPNTR